MYTANLGMDEDIFEDSSRKKKVKTILLISAMPLTSSHAAQKITCW
jgi:hypothetical protein